MTIFCLSNLIRYIAVPLNDPIVCPCIYHVRSELICDWPVFVKKIQNAEIKLTLRALSFSEAMIN